MGTIGGVAQLGEHLLCKQGVIGSIPFTSTRYFGCVMTERLVFGASVQSSPIALMGRLLFNNLEEVFWCLRKPRRYQDGL
jgi:hypothetical protein